MTINQIVYNIRNLIRDAKHDECVEIVQEQLNKKDLSKRREEGEKGKEEVKNKKKGNKGEG